MTDESAALIGLAAKLVAQQDGDRDAVLPEMRGLGARMQAEAGTLVNRLRAAATAIEQGRPAEQLGLAADNWSVTVGILLGGAEALDIGGVEDLHTLVERLTELDAEHTERVAKRLADAQVAEELIEVLERQGRAAMIEANLTQLGFTSIDEVKAVLAGADARPARDVVDASSSSEARGGDEKAGAAAVEEEGGTEEFQVEAAEAAEEEEAEEAAEEPEREDTAEASGGEQSGAGESAAEGEQSGAEPVAEDSAPAAADAPPADSSFPADAQPGISESADISESAQTEIGGEDEASPADFPWDVGDPPLIGRLLLEGREGLAYHLAVAAVETNPRRQLLLFACAAANCDTEALELSLLPADADIRAFDANESRLLLAAALRAGMRLGYAPLGFQSLIDSAGLGDTGLMDVFTAAANAVQRGHTRRQPQSGPSAEELATRWAELGREAGERLDKLRTRILKFQRGSKVLRQMAKDGQPLAEALSAAAAITADGVAGASGPQWAQISHLVEQLNDHHKREKFIDAADAEVSTSQQRRRPIIGPVNAQLHESCAMPGTCYRDCSMCVGRSCPRAI